MKKIIVCSFCFLTSISIQAQFYGGVPVEMPTMSIYDKSAMLMYYNALEQMRQYTATIRPIIDNTYRVAFKEYNEGNYQKCIDIIKEFYDNVVIYKVQASLCIDLDVLIGDSYCKIDNQETGFFYLKKAMGLGSNSARTILDDYFQRYIEWARSNYHENNYYLCDWWINKALTTGLENADIYVLAGDSYLQQHKFSEAKANYKLARRLGDKSYSERVRKLKTIRKELKK